MPIIEKEKWAECVKNNARDDHGKPVVDVARRVMEILDEGNPFECHQIICQAREDVGVDPLSGFQASCLASMVIGAHSRGKEFHEAWNLENQINQIPDDNEPIGDNVAPGISDHND